MDVFYRIRSLFALGYDVLLVSFYNPTQSFPDTSVLEQYCKKIFSIPYARRNLKKFFSWKPYSIATREVWDALDEVFEQLNREQFTIDAVIAESHHVITVAERAKNCLNIPRVFLRSHNHEPKFMWGVALSSNFFSLERFFFLAEAFKYTLYLPNLMKRLDGSASIWHISFDECRKAKKRYPLHDHQFLPAGIDLSKLKLRNVCLSKKVLFTGALFSPNNIHGINWYLKKVHPLMIANDKDYQLIIAGNTSGARREDLQKLTEYKRVSLYDTPENMDPIYDEAHVFINPMRLGAGVKLKTLDAAIRGVPVVTTATGNEGTGLVHEKEVLVADSPEAFSRSLCQLLESKEKCTELSRNAHQFLNNHYHQESSLEKLMRK